MKNEKGKRFVALIFGNFWLKALAVVCAVFTYIVVSI